MEKILKILNARFCKLTKNSAIEKRTHRYSQKSLRRGNKAEGDKYQRLFVKKSLQYLPHHLLLAVSHRIRLRWAEKILDKFARKYIIKPKSIRQFKESEIKEYQKLTKGTQFWHGTGRWQHGEHGITDVLKSFCDAAGLKPARDVYAVFGGSKQRVVYSVSLCRSRMIARSYADMHRLGWKEENRYGDALTWVSYYYGMFYARLFITSGFKMMRRWKAWRALSRDNNGDNTWGKKVNIQARNVWDVFCLGSDISGNYPILIGVKNIYSQIKLDKPMCQYEVRASKLINIANISHVEVPYDKQDEVRKLLRKHDVKLPVTSIELGEYVSSKERFIDLISAL